MDACQECEARRTFVKRVAGVVAGLWMVGNAPPVFATGSRGVGTDVSYPIPDVDGVTIDRENEVILVRAGTTVIAFALSCPHQRTALKWVDADHRFQCPKHKSRYQPTGEFISGRATRNMDRYPIRRDGSKVVVNVDVTIASDKDPKGWAAAQVTS